MLSFALVLTSVLLVVTTIGTFLTSAKNKALERDLKLLEIKYKTEITLKDTSLVGTKQDLYNLANETSKTITDLRSELAKQVGRNKSIEVRTGQIMEKIVPFLEVFKHNPDNICHLGQPIDYICWEDDEIVIVEVKSGNAKMTSKQRAIKKLIEDKKVRFELIRLNVDPTKDIESDE